ncbi:hypothetical protein GE09DRAFT_1214207 [Coniochaeta sp. 2T2.1]|nr:hypothetical protein GE09DRAFT_1214207 [Coniochaeta sp. 2T2.1]
MAGLAVFRPAPQYDDLSKLAQAHFNHDLSPDDKSTLRAASRKVSNHTVLGSLLGLGLGAYAAVRLRRVRADMFQAFRGAEKPTRVVFADGSSEAVPDLTPFVRPTKWGDWATYFFFGLGGLFLGGETGFMTGSWSAARLITADPVRKDRIEDAYRRFRIDLLRKEVERLEVGHTPFHHGTT